MGIMPCLLTGADLFAAFAMVQGLVVIIYMIMGHPTKEGARLRFPADTPQSVKLDFARRYGKAWPGKVNQRMVVLSACKCAIMDYVGPTGRPGDKKSRLGADFEKVRLQRVRTTQVVVNY
jgi:hypothetical protein